MLDTIRIDRFIIEHNNGQVLTVHMPDDVDNVSHAAADCIEAMAIEIIKMRELLQAVSNANEYEVGKHLTAIDQYIASLPK